MAKLNFINPDLEREKRGVIVASGWKANGETIRLVFRKTVTDPQGKRQAIDGPIAFSANEVLLVVPVKKKQSGRSPDYIALAFPEG